MNLGRTFIAADVDHSTAIGRVLGDLKEMGRGLKIIAPENLHITLRFLGPIGPEGLDDMIAAMRIATEDVKPFELDLVGTGAFPNIHRASVVWVGCERSEPLKLIVDRLNPLIDSLGFQSEQRSWTAHLTIARVKGRPARELKTYLEDWRATKFGQCLIDTIKLKSSTLSRSGASYETIEEVALRDAISSVI